MNFNRLLIASLVLSLSFIPGVMRSQEAVEKRSLEEASPRPEQEPSVSVQPEESPKREKSEKVERPAKQEQPTRVLQDMMTAKEFRAAGLEKLSEEELRNLNAWLQGYRQTTETKATEKATAEVTKKVGAQSRAKMDIINSRVDGTFDGITGHTVIKLEDGTVWKQALATDKFRAQITDHPNVAVIHTVYGYKMRILGTPEFYVDPVRK